MSGPGNTLMVPIGAAYLMVVVAGGTIAGGGFYMGSLQRQIESHAEHLKEVDRQEDEFRRRLESLVSPIRQEINAAILAQSQDMAERRKDSEKTILSVSNALQDVNNRLIKLEATVNLVASQMPAPPSYVAGPGRR